MAVKSLGPDGNLGFHGTHPTQTHKRNFNPTTWNLVSLSPVVVRPCGFWYLHFPWNARGKDPLLRVAGFRGLPDAGGRRCVGWGMLGWGTCEITRVDWEEMDMVRDLDGRWDVIHNQSIEMTLHARTIWEARHTNSTHVTEMGMGKEQFGRKTQYPFFCDLSLSFTIQVSSRSVDVAVQHPSQHTNTLVVYTATAFTKRSNHPV
jgi:hypothetical protein